MVLNMKSYFLLESDFKEKKELPKEIKHPSKSKNL